MKIQTLCLLSIFGLILSQEFTSDIKKDLARKLSSSIPQYDRETFNRLSHDPRATGGSFWSNGNTSGLNDIKNTEINLDIFHAKPFQEAVALRWGTRLESLTSQTQLTMQGDTLSYSAVTGTLGERVDDKVSIIVAVGNASTKLHTQYNTIKYDHCWEIFRIIHCEARYRDEPRGYTFEETLAVNQGILDLAHQGAIGKLDVAGLVVALSFDSEEDATQLKVDLSNRPLNLLELNYLEAMNSKNLGEDRKIFSSVAYEVPSAEVGACVNELIHGNTTPSFIDKINENVEAGSDATITQSSAEGIWTVKMFKNEHGSWTVSAGL